MPDPVIVIGAGPAGLTAALRLVQAGREVMVLEVSETVGGISRTVEVQGWRFDIGGHRFFTKVKEVEEFWHELLPEPEEFLERTRLSRIYYRGRFYDYPIRPMNALWNLGPVEALRCLGSYLWVRALPSKELRSLEDYLVASYGRRLFHHFFEAYTEKVWGVPASQLSADWGAQRIKGMSLWNAVWEPIRARLLSPRQQGAQVTSLIERFRYPRLGPGMMWERCRDLVVGGGGTVRHGARVTEIECESDKAVAVRALVDGQEVRLPCSAVISTAPLAEVVTYLDPPAPTGVLQAASQLSFRDFLTVALVIDGPGFRDNWIYIHEPDVLVGRVQNYGRWSPDMVKESRTCLGMEYFVHMGDGLWTSTDEDLIELATDEVVRLGLVPVGGVERGFVVRVPQAYPVYDEGYGEHVEVLRRFLESHTVNLWPVGRNGMHRYNNQDHSMLTAMLAVDNVLGASHDVWEVNVEQDFHESGTTTSKGRRDAPVVPRAVSAVGAKTP